MSRGYNVIYLIAYLINVHVALSTTSRLEDDEWEVFNEFAGDDLCAGVKRVSGS